MVIQVRLGHGDVVRPDDVDDQVPIRARRQVDTGMIHDRSVDGECAALWWESDGVRRFADGKQGVQEFCHAGKIPEHFEPRESKQLALRLMAYLLRPRSL